MFIFANNNLVFYFMCWEIKSNAIDNNCLKWLQNRDLGLILWENEAVRLINNFRSVFEQIKI